MEKRQIKFRAFDLESKKMFLVNKLLWGAYPVEPFQAQGIIVGDEIKVMNICEDDCENKSPHCKLMQFTGLKDKNGKEIYEGDVVKFLGQNCEIWWQDFAGYWAVDMKGKKPDHLKEERTLMQYNLQMEIVGNIYENPNLLSHE